MQIDPNIGAKFPGWVGDWVLDYADRRPCSVDEAWGEALDRFADLRKPAAAVVELAVNDYAAARDILLPAA